MSDVPFPFGGAHGATHHQQQQSAPMLNGTSVAQAQQPPVSPMAALPPHLMAALQGIAPEQLGAIFQAFQSGLIPMPPANLASTQPTPAPPTINAPLPIHLADSSRASGAVGASSVDVNMDQEDGEIEDGEVDGASTPQSRGFLRTPPRGPRDSNSRRGSHQFQQHAQQAARPGLPSRASSSTLSKTIIPNGKAPVVRANAPSRPSKEAASKAFIREMYHAGYSYDDLLREVKDANMLRRMYEQLSLPTSSPSLTKAASSPVDTTRKQATAKLPAKPVKSPAAPPKDRSEYLAKLQAAKAKKTEAAKSSTNASAVTQPVQPAVTQPAATPPSQPQANVPVAPLRAAVVAPSQPGAKNPMPMSKEKTDELRRRLEAIKAKRAAEQHAKLSSDTAQPSSPANRSATGDSTPQQTGPQLNVGLGAGLTEAAAKAMKSQADRSAPVIVLPAQAVNTGFAMPSSGTASPLLNRGSTLPGLSLPGLFTSYTPQAAPATSSPRLPTNGSSTYAVPSAASTSGLGVRPESTAPLASQNAVSATRVSTDDEQPQLGQRNNVRASEQYVIEVSSDEEDDMDTDDSSEEEHAPPAPGQEGVRQLSGHQNGVSAPGTPNAYKRKLEEIEQFKQQIAEQEKRRKLANLQGGRPDTTAASMVHAVNSGEAGADAASADVASAVPSSAAVAATRLARAQEKEALQRRLRELQALRSKHESASPALAQVTTSRGEDRTANEQARTTAVTSRAPADVNDTMDDVDDVDDEDDEDLYGNDTNEQGGASYAEAQDARVQSLADSQTTPGSQQSAMASASGQDDEVEAAEDACYQDRGVKFIEPESIQKAPADDEDECDDDDLDNIYEPSETVTQVPAPPKPQVETTGAYLDSDDAMDTSAESSDDSESAYEPDAAIEPAQQSPGQLSSAGTRHSEGLDQQADEADLAPELQSARETLHSPTDANGPVSYPRYTPYESALRLFKDYRFHPDFTNIVPAGFKSLTYNHKIDPMLTVCPAELLSGQCDNSNCGYQHFHQMSLQDNDLLRLLGTERTPARSTEEQQRWKEGLQNLVKELRTTNFGKDAGLIAQRIAEYRRAFVNDPTRIVVLDD